MAIAAASPSPSSSIAVWRILNFWTLPVTVIGKPSTNLRTAGSGQGVGKVRLMLSALTGNVHAVAEEALPGDLGLAFRLTR